MNEAPPVLVQNTFFNPTVIGQVEDEKKVKDIIQACAALYANHRLSQWTRQSPGWEFGRSGRGNFAFASNRYHIGLDSQTNQIYVLDKKNENAKLRDPLSVLSQELPKLQALSLIMKINAQIEIYKKNMHANPTDAEKRSVWNDKIEILILAKTHLEKRENKIDLDKAAEHYPHCRDGDSLIRTSETSKLLNEVKAFKPWASPLSPRLRGR